MVSKEDLSRINEQVKFTKELAEEVRHLPVHSFKWDGRMTSAAGRIVWRNGQTTIKLSSKIFLKAVEDRGIDATCDEIHETLLHEYGHLVVGHPEHGSDWKLVVEEFGGNAEVYHDLATGMGLVPDELRSKFYKGARVSFTVKGETFVGTVVKHNTTNARVKVLLPQTKAGGQWNIPWAIADRTLKVV